MMKKSAFIVGLLSLLLLSACGNHNDQKATVSSQKTSSKASVVSSNRSQVSQQESSSAAASSVQSNESSNASTKMNLEEIKAGNYSSLQGHWRLKQAVAQHKDITDSSESSLTISQNRLTTSQLTLDANGLKDSDGTHAVTKRMENGALEESLADAAHVAINWSVTFYPAGTTGEYADAEHTNSENTIVIWTSNMSSTDVFVEDNGSDKESTTHDPSWNDQKDQELAACMEQFGHTMDQSYERYTGDHELKTYVGETYPAALKSTVVDGQKGQIGWSPTGKGSYAYNVVAVYNHNPVPKSQIGRITYAFAFHNGQPVVLVDQSTNGDPTMQVTKNDKLKTAFANIADNR